MVFMDREGVVTCPTDWPREDRGLESNRKSNSFLISDSQGLVQLFSQFPALGLWINPFRVIIYSLTSHGNFGNNFRLQWSHEIELLQVRILVLACGPSVTRTNVRFGLILTLRSGLLVGKFRPSRVSSSHVISANASG